MHYVAELDLREEKSYFGDFARRTPTHPHGVP
jgi:hypothetical protein